MIDDPFLHLNGGKPWRERGRWPAWWIGLASEQGGMDAPIVVAYRLNFAVAIEDADETIRVHVAADEKYRLWLDGEQIGSGGESGDPANWYFDSYDLNLTAGSHCLVALVWAKGWLAGLGQMSVQPGFLLAAENNWTDRLSTGLAPWDAQKIDGYTFVKYEETHLREGMTHMDGRAIPWGFEHGNHGSRDRWRTAERLAQGVGRPCDFDIHRQHWLTPATLPKQRETIVELSLPEPCEGSKPSQGFAPSPLMEIPAYTTERHIIDLDAYLCAYPIVTTSGGAGAVITLRWCEALRQSPNWWEHEKGHRDEIAGKFFVGCANQFTLDGGERRVYEPLEWNAGRYVEVEVTTAEHPVIIHAIQLRTTEYPLEIESSISCSDNNLNALIPMLTRGLTASAHDVYSDSPYFEQLMYAADTRIELLCTYVLTREIDLSRKVLHLFNSSRLPSGFIQARYPSREPQLIAPFTIWWIGMVHDFLYWRDDLPFVKRLLPGVRSSAEAFLRYQNDAHLITPLPGWLFFDWVPEWEAGIPPGALDEVHGLVNWQVVYGWSLVANLETQLGEPELAALWARRTAQLADACAVFWDDERGLMADDVAHTQFSEHTQVMAILSGRLTPSQEARVAHGLLHDPDLTRTTVYFCHYLFEAYQRIGAIDQLLKRLEPWHEMHRNGLKTPCEKPEPSRSDCHGWSAHPLYHLYATVGGVRPTSPGFRTHTITPQLGNLAFVRGHIATPHGIIDISHL